ncbi:inter-alpha-trypsin inhibitor heavy chain H4-like isoform X2 [Periplaneta americana]|uniref:inter-alpha-trypsin inhibitor heavy chain H4-like isoform X2 n=1 Tax=Periplaneta americana TaxID=6978 RepID=UPI0037E947A1
MQVVWLVIVTLCCRGVLPDVVVSTSEGVSEAVNHGNEVSKLEMYKLHVESSIKFRFAHTVVSCKIANPANISQEATFSAVLPDTAFISGFLMEIEDHVYHAYVREKEAARQEYSRAVSEGRTAAHVALSARDSNRFTVSVNVEPQKKVTFNLTYEELLSRKLGTYKHVINLDPGQIVRDLSVEVHINESADITTLNVPALRTSNEIDADPSTGAVNSLVTIERPTAQSALVRFAPTPDQQRDLASDGIKGQLIVEYDVNRTEHPTQVLVNDGYFVHFFAPADLPPLPKQVTFVLDVSGSMGGRKIEQLRQAMRTILSDLNPGDLFSIVLFSSEVEVWDSALSVAANNEKMHGIGGWRHRTESPNITLAPSVIATASPHNITKAKEFVDTLISMGATNINGALMKALEISKLGGDSSPSEETNNLDPRPEPITIFLTDGQPNVGVSQPKEIVSGVTAANTGNSSIFSLALGSDADFGFLKKLSLRNTGFARKIYEASDTALQLRDFYRQVASPLLANVTFNYQEGEVAMDSLTKVMFRRFFSGSELVVAGRLQGVNVTGQVTGRTTSGSSHYPVDPIILPFIEPPMPPPDANLTPSTMERLWAYLTIQQLLEEGDAKDDDGNRTSPEQQKALDLALRYSFVTPLTSLVVVKPNDTSAVNAEDASHPDYSPMSVPLGMPGAMHLANLLPAPLMRPVYLEPRSSSGSQSFPNFASYPIPQSSMINAPRLSSGIVLPSSRDAIGSDPIDNAGGESRLMTISGLPGSLPTLVNISAVTWLPDNHTITIQMPILGIDGDFQIAGPNETNVPSMECLTPSSGPGHCRHFRYCVLSDFANDRGVYYQYFCQISGYAGVCCPDFVTTSTT